MQGETSVLSKVIHELLSADLASLSSRNSWSRKWQSVRMVLFRKGILLWSANALQAMVNLQYFGGGQAFTANRARENHRIVTLLETIENAGSFFYTLVVEPPCKR